MRADVRLGARLAALSWLAGLLCFWICTCTVLQAAACSLAGGRSWLADTFRFTDCAQGVFLVPVMGLIFKEAGQKAPQRLHARMHTFYSAM